MARTKKEAPKATVEAENPSVDSQDEPKVEIIAEAEPAIEKSEPKSVDGGVAELKRRLEAAEEAQVRLTRERNEAVQRAYVAKNETEDTNLRLIESAIGQVVEANKGLKRDYAAALAAQDYERAADIQEALALNQAKALQLENGKQSLKERPKEQPRPLDPVEAFAAQLSPRSAAWVRAHPEYATNPKLTQKMIAAHQLAVADGLAADTDDYFESVEDTLKLNRRQPSRAIQEPEDEESFSEGSRAVGGRQTQPAALPVSRDISPSGERQRVVRASAAQVAAAADSHMTIEEYMAQVRRIERERRESMN